MEQQLYERPRERIRARKAHLLTTTELLQVIIGSGSKNYAVARLAKHVGDLLASNPKVGLYDALCAIPGVGDATACRVIAALYLQIDAHKNEGHYLDSLDLSDITARRRLSVSGFTFNAEHKLVSIYALPIKEKRTTSVIAKQLFSKALSDGADSLVVVIGCQKQLLKPGMLELGILNDLKELTAVTKVKLGAVVLVNKVDKTYLYGGSLNE